MQSEKLTDIKKELVELTPKQLVDVCIRLAKYKKENKELLSYILYSSDDPISYAEKIKEALQPEFSGMQKHHYYSTKALRKILRTLNRHAKYTANKQVEIELLLWFCTNFLNYADLRSSYKPLAALFARQLEKIANSIKKLHEDLVFDYQQEFEKVLEKAAQELKGFQKNNLKL